VVGREREAKDGAPGGPHGADGRGAEGVPTGGESALRRRRALRVVDLDVLAVVRADSVHGCRDRARAGVRPTTVGRHAVVGQWGRPVGGAPALVVDDAANAVLAASARVSAAPS